MQSITLLAIGLTCLSITARKISPHTVTTTPGPIYDFSETYEVSNVLRDLYEKQLEKSIDVFDDLVKLALNNHSSDLSYMEGEYLNHVIGVYYDLIGQVYHSCQKILDDLFFTIDLLPLKDGEDMAQIDLDDAREDMKTHIKSFKESLKTIPEFSYDIFSSAVGSCGHSFICSFVMSPFKSKLKLANRRFTVKVQSRIESLVEDYVEQLVSMPLSYMRTVQGFILDKEDFLGDHLIETENSTPAHNLI